MCLYHSGSQGLRDPSFSRRILTSSLSLTPPPGLPNYIHTTAVMHGVRCRVALPALLGIRHRAFLLHLVAPNFLLSETLSFSRCCCCRHYSNQTLLIVCKKPLTLSRLFTNHTEPEEGAKGREEAERGGEAQSGLESE